MLKKFLKWFDENFPKPPPDPKERLKARERRWVENKLGMPYITEEDHIRMKEELAKHEF